MGIPLNAIPDVRRFMGREDPYGDSKIDFMTENYPDINTHVIAARITAENPDEVCVCVFVYVSVCDFCVCVCEKIWI